MSETDCLGNVEEFSAFVTPLKTGVNLIEASAGTGKTYSIAMLVLRFVVEKKLKIEQILVVTFTNAATQELKTRIRRRLQDLKNYLNNHEHSDGLDEAFMQWADQLTDRQEVISLLTQALAAIDNAAIFTIHSFCQRMLRQFALESGQLFDAELITNQDELKLSLAEDYWRQQLYDASALKVALLTNNFSTPQALVRSINTIHAGMRIIPEKQDVDQLIGKIETNCSVLASQLEQAVLTPLSKLISSDPANFKETFLSSFEGIKRAVLDWVAGDNLDIPIKMLKQLSFVHLLTNALNGNKFRKTKLASAEERKQAYLQDAGVIELSVLDELALQTEQLSISFRLGLFEYLQNNLDSKKDALNVLSYDDLITRLSKAIESQDRLLSASLQRQFEVALIDEFQDTDQQQWDIFSKVYNTSQHYLYLIGDPKQAVYKFRGADIYSYLDAKKTANHAYTLNNNFRSAPALLESINTLYSKSKTPFLIEGIPYHPIKSGKPDDAQWVGKRGLMFWYLEDNPDHKDGYWSSGTAREVIRTAVINEIITLLQKTAGNETLLSPSDFAILVRGNDEAANYQWALQQAGVPAVINSKRSVFDSDEAHYLQQLLTAIERPADLNCMRQALVLPWFDLDGQAFDALCRDDFALQQYVSEFQNFQERWQDSGLMAMMKSLLDHYKILQVLSKDESAERRITNLHHLLEVIQQVVLDERLDTHKTLDWLILTIGGENRGDGTELRLEQDQDAVNVVTIHSAKGLEYPIVFAPELWYERPAKTTATKDEVVVCHQQGQLIADLGSELLSEHFEQARFEQQAEDLRLLYVAITRAASRCYVPWATVRSLKKDNQSALAYLLESHEGDDWLVKLNNLAKSAGGVEFETVPAEQVALTRTSGEQRSTSLNAKTATRTIKQEWRMSSYSSLAYLSQHEHELPQDKSQEPIEAEEALPEPTVEVLPKGAHTGNVLHDLLENHSFAQLAELNVDNEHYDAYVAARARSCVRYGLVLEPGAERALDQLLMRSVAAPLDLENGDFLLANIPENDCLKEMAFYFSVNQLQTSAINQLLVDQPSYQPLSMRQLSGQLTGFIDLICRYQGRYYVMDYKSNSLQNYDTASLQSAMQQHNYGLQYFIYSLVLHNYLMQRLPDYNYEQHFGGVRYLFLRGMDKSQPMQGVFVDKPSLEIIEGLGKVLNGVVK